MKKVDLFHGVHVGLVLEIGKTNQALLGIFMPQQWILKLCNEEQGWHTFYNQNQNQIEMGALHMTINM